MGCLVQKTTRLRPKSVMGHIGCLSRFSSDRDSYGVTLMTSLHYSNRRVHVAIVKFSTILLSLAARGETGG